MEDPAKRYRELVAIVATMEAEIASVKSDISGISSACESLARTSVGEMHLKGLEASKREKEAELEQKLTAKRETANEAEGLKREVSKELFEFVQGIKESAEGLLLNMDVRRDDVRRRAALDEMRVWLDEAAELDKLICQFNPNANDNLARAALGSESVEVPPVDQTLSAEASADATQPTVKTKPLLSIKGLPEELSQFQTSGKSGNSLKDFARIHAEGVTSLSAYFGDDLAGITAELKMRGLNGGYLTNEQVRAILPTGSKPQAVKANPTDLTPVAATRLSEASVRSAPSKLRVKLAVGALEEENATATFTKAIGLAGIERVKWLNISLNGEPLVTKYDQGRYPRKKVSDFGYSE